MKYDIVFKNGKIVDGTGNPWFFGDVAIQEDNIVKVKKNIPENQAKRVIDIKGKIISPGFIDTHSHADMGVLLDPSLPSLINQGITTCVVQNCGGGVAPIAPERREQVVKEIIPEGFSYTPSWNSMKEFFSFLNTTGTVLNIVALIPYELIRMGYGPNYEKRAPNGDEYHAMKQAIRDSMEAGAVGLSTGIVFPPQVFAQTEELTELMKVVAEYDGLYASHMRDEANRVVEAVEEFIQIVQNSGARHGQISHHKICGRQNWGLSKTTMKLISQANDSGLNIRCDQYPYTRGGSPIGPVLPPWTFEGGSQKAIEILKSPELRQKVRYDIENGLPGWENRLSGLLPEDVYISHMTSPNAHKYLRKNLKQITEMEGYKDHIEAVFELLLESNGQVWATVEIVSEDEIADLLTYRNTMIGSDGMGSATSGPLNFGIPHPREYGTYPRILGRYVREKGILSIEDAIRKMTSFPAQQFQLFNRGILRECMAADITVFDPNAILDLSTYDNPFQYSKGVEWVFVGGESVIEHGIQNSNLPGKVLTPLIR